MPLLLFVECNILFCEVDRRNRSIEGELVRGINVVCTTAIGCLRDRDRTDGSLDIVKLRQTQRHASRPASVGKERSFDTDKRTLPRALSLAGHAHLYMISRGSVGSILQVLCTRRTCGARSASAGSIAPCRCAYLSRRQFARLVTSP